MAMDAPSLPLPKAPLSPHLCAEPPSSTCVTMMLWGDRFDPLPPVIWIPSPSVPFMMCILHMRQPSRWEKTCRESLNFDLDTERGLGGYRKELFSSLLPITTHLYSSSYTGAFAELAVLVVVQAKEAERRRQDRAGSPRRGFLAGLFAAFLSHVEVLLPTPRSFLKQPAASNPFAKTQGWAVQGCGGARPCSRGTLNTR